jgi:farnesyl diphosphate synthase
MKRPENNIILNELSLNELRKICPDRLNHIYSIYLNDIPSLELKSAMAYALGNGGKYVRPLLIYATGTIFDAPLENLDIPAASVELIHTYSLLHDDLPCMDNADIRRGKPSCHKVFGDSMTVLTGDALHTLAMQIIASSPASLRPDKRLKMMYVLSKACGPYGMAGGQAMDITLMNDETITSPMLIDIYRLKTGALFTASLLLGRLASGDDDERNERALKEFGAHIGLAFQIQDDIFDVMSTEATIGKPQGSDNQNKKTTYPKIEGIEKAQQKVNSLYEGALETINYLGDRAELLRDLTQFLLQRDR